MWLDAISHLNSIPASAPTSDAARYKALLIALTWPDGATPNEEDDFACDKAAALVGGVTEDYTIRRYTPDEQAQAFFETDYRQYVGVIAGAGPALITL